MAFFSTRVFANVCKTSSTRATCFRVSVTPSAALIHTFNPICASKLNSHLLYSHPHLNCLRKTIHSSSRIGYSTFLNLKNLENPHNSPHSLLLRMLSSTSSALEKAQLGNTEIDNAVNKPNVKSTAENESPPVTPAQSGLSTKEKLKQAVRDYGATVLVFHITMSLMSLGFCYVLVSSGLDVAVILGKLGISENILQSKVTEEASKFVVAYAVHKVFAPLRITITLTATPLIVRKLRNMGILKQVVKAKTKSS